MNDLVTISDVSGEGIHNHEVNPPNTSVREDWYFEALGGRATSSGTVVNANTALQYGPVWACINAISNDMGGLDTELIRRKDGTEIRQENNDLDWLINGQPNEYQTSYQFKEWMFGSALSWGNGIAWIDKMPSGKITLRPLMPDRTVYHEVAPDQFVIHSRIGRYHTSSDIFLLPEQTLHLRGFTRNGFWGLSPATVCRETLGNGIAQEEHGGSTFRNGAKLSGLIQLAKRMSPENKALFRRDWKAVHSGSANSGNTGILDPDMSWVNVAMSNHDAQWLESQKLSRNQIAMIYSVPPFRMQDYETSSVRANLEAQFKSYVRTSLRPWGVRFEQECENKLLTVPERKPTPRTGSMFYRTNYDPLTEGTSDERSQRAALEIRSRIATQNEARQMTGKNPVPGGDEFSNPAIEPAPESQESIDAETQQDTADEPADNDTSNSEAVENLVRSQVHALIGKEVRQLKYHAKNAKDFASWIENYYAVDFPEIAQKFLQPACDAAKLNYQAALERHISTASAGMQNGMDADWISDQVDFFVRGIIDG